MFTHASPAQNAATSAAPGTMLDEDNAATLYRDPVGWTIHRKRAWVAALSQAHYDFIDFSITVGSEAGTKESSAQIRTWMKHLSTFLHSFPFVGAAPLADWVEKKPEHVVSATLGVGGVQYVTYLADAREVTDQAAGTPIEGEVTVRLSAGDYQVSAFSPTTGKREALMRVSGGNQPVSIKLPPVVHDMVLVVLRACVLSLRAPFLVVVIAAAVVAALLRLWGWAA